MPDLVKVNYAHTGQSTKINYDAKNQEIIRRK